MSTEVKSLPGILKLPPGMPQAILFMGLGIGVLAAHFMLSAAFGIYGFVWIVLIVAASFMVAWELGFALLLGILFLQNAFIGAVLPLMDDPGHFSIMLGSGFAVTALMAVVYGPVWLKMRRNMPAEADGILRWMILFFIVVAAYTALGAAYVSFTSTLVYARVYFTGAFMLIIGVVMGFRLSFGFVSGVVRLLAIMLIAWAIFEYFFTYGLYDVFNVVQFFNFKLSSLSNNTAYASIQEIIEDSTSSYLNLSGQFGLNLDLLRLAGPNLHSISYAYALAFCCLLCFIYRRPLLMGLSLVLLLLVGAKGPLLMTFLSIAMSIFYGRTRNPRWLMVLLAGVLGIFLVSGLIYGIASGDYHVIGLLGGLTGFVHNPLGHGIGVGGNMSTLGMQKSSNADFSLFQGYGADFALESGIGVMLYQIGLATIVFFVFYWKLWKSVWETTTAFATETRLVTVPVVLAFLFVDGVFQEEVFSPTGWGLWLLFSGLLLTQRWMASNEAAR